jgi:zinc transport system substrate-binding protein
MDTIRNLMSGGCINPGAPDTMTGDCGKTTSIGRHAAGVICTALVLLYTMPVWASSLGVFVSIAPQKYFARKIGGNLINVSILVPTGADPHTYEPKPRQMVELSKSALYFAVGVDFEKAWLKRIAATHPRMRIISTDEGIAKIPMTDPHRHEGDPHRPDKKPGHHDGAPDPHVWLAPGPVKVQAAHILKALIETDPKNRLQYSAGYDSFLKELDALDGELRALFAGRKGERFMVFHPAWGYFAEAYGLEQVPVEAGGKEPKAAQLQALIRRARERGVKVIFVQPQLSAKSAEMVAREIGGAVVYADPLAENWDANMREVARKFRAALQ